MKKFLSQYGYLILTTICIVIFIIYPIYYLIQKRKDLNNEYKLLREIESLFQNPEWDKFAEYVSNTYSKPTNVLYDRRTQISLDDCVRNYSRLDEFNDITEQILKNCYAIQKLSSYSPNFDSPIKKFVSLPIIKKFDMLSKIHIEASARLLEIDVEKSQFSYFENYKKAIKHEIHWILSSPKNLIECVVSLIKSFIVVLLVSILL